MAFGRKSDLRSPRLGWADSLQNSDVRGQRYLTDRTRAAADRRQRADAFMQKVDRMVEEGRRERQAKAQVQREMEQAHGGERDPEFSGA